MTGAIRVIGAASSRARTISRGATSATSMAGWCSTSRAGCTRPMRSLACSGGCRPQRPGIADRTEPLPSGGLPIPLGEATKTVPFVMDGRKRYRFTVAWGEERDTDDTEGRAVKTSELRPSTEAILALLPRFTGMIEQTPPQYSAIKVQGARGYDLARDRARVA